MSDNGTNFTLVISYEARPWPFGWGPFRRPRPWPFAWGPFGGWRRRCFRAAGLRLDVFQRDGGGRADWPVTLRCGEESGRLVTTARYRDTRWTPQVTKS